MAIIKLERMNMLIKNIKGTSRYRDPYGHESWIDYWCKHRYKVYVCASVEMVVVMI